MNVLDVAVSENMDAMAGFFADMSCLQEGLKAGTKEYEKCFSASKQRFLEEAFLHSLTPSGEIGANPLPQKLRANLGIDKLVKKYFSGSREESEILTNQINSALNNLSSAFMQIRLNKTVKERFGKKSDLAYQKGQKGEGAKESVEKSRYLALMVASMMYGYIYKFFDQDLTGLEPFLVDQMKEVTGGDLKKLNTEKARKAFVNNLFNITLELD